ncbi:hypothetical protein BKA65DRAFT_407035 [Rhexocercosporidium sp. MPI-PUGE-AT-0058]|nr:hypothetical protein BKA65DRAFT_407035 [Rhexocercosporidium sp. MPI-PUGE-AT-0058]
MRHLEVGLPAQIIPVPQVPIDIGQINPPIHFPAGADVQTAPPQSARLSAVDAQVSNEILPQSTTASLVDLSKALFDQIKSVIPQSGAPAFTPPPENEIHFALSNASLDILPLTVKDTLASRDIDISSQPVDSTTNALQRHLTANATELDTLYQGSKSQVSKIRRVGNTIVKYQNMPFSGWATAFARGDLDPVLEDPPIGKPRGRITKLLKADLLVVKQQLIGYQKGDIAYIHNVLKSESNSRDTAVTHSTTETTTLETETTTDKQTDVTTTDRFEMSKETQATIKEAESLKAGATMSASYGPAVQVSASANAAMDRSQEESSKSASKFSKDVTNKASDRIQKRVLQRQTVTSTTTSTEKEHHAFDNKGGHAHISGVYQWLNKVYEAQTWCYGKRTIIDIMIPEPGAFLLDKAANTKSTKSDDIVMVPPFIATAKEITEVTYQGFAETYGVTDLEPPPRAYSRKAAACAMSVGQPHIYSQVIAIDAGLHVTGISAQGKSFHWVWRPNDGDMQTRSRVGHNEENEVAFSVTGQSMSQLGVNIELLLKRTDEALSNWQNKTWAHLRAAHDKLVELQNTALQQAAFDASIGTPGTNPAANLAVMNSEIKKHCLEIITDQHFENFHAVSTVAVGDPELGIKIDEVDIDRAWNEGPYVRFFEQAFEWEEMTWITYPYFWGRKDHWYSKIEYEDPDPLFQKFMQAGYARANVPVRPGFEGALDHFLATGKPWDGGPLPGISSKLFLPLAAEIQESLGRAADEPVPYPGGPWEVIVPTNLVRLRKDDETPVWVKKGDKREEVEDKIPAPV